MLGISSAPCCSFYQPVSDIVQHRYNEKRSDIILLPPKPLDIKTKQLKKFTLILIISSLSFALLWACSTSPERTQTFSYEEEVMTHVGKIPTPKGYERISVKPASVGAYFRNLSLKEDNTVYLYNGQKKWNQRAQFAVIDIDVGNKDLQQCADAVMRLRAEYQFHSGNHNDIQFHFTSGDLAKWTRYAEGYRAKISGNTVQWVKSAQPDTSYACFRKYMNLIFSYCGTLSMNREVKPISAANIRPGDVFHQTGNPYGHAVTVMDVAEDSTGKKVFMLSQSYMPAQSIHILQNPNNSKLSPWYSYTDGEELETPEWTFPAGSLKRWK